MKETTIQFFIVLTFMCSSCKQVDENDKQFVAREAANFSFIQNLKGGKIDTSDLTAHLISNYSSSHKIEIFYFYGPSIERAGLGPAFMVKYKNYRNVFFPFVRSADSKKVELSYLQRKKELINLNTFVNSLSYFKDEQVADFEKSLLLRKLYLWTVVQKPYINQSIPTNLPMNYFFNLRNLFEIKDVAELQKTIHKALIQHEYAIPVLPFRSDVEDNQEFDIENLKSSYEKRIEKKGHEIGVQQTKMLSSIQTKKQLILSEIEKKRSHFYLTIPNMRVHRIKVFKHKGNWFVIGTEMNREYDDYLFF